MPLGSSSPSGGCYGDDILRQRGPGRAGRIVQGQGSKRTRAPRGRTTRWRKEQAENSRDYEEDECTHFAALLGANGVPWRDQGPFSTSLDNAMCGVFVSRPEERRRDQGGCAREERPSHRSSRALLVRKTAGPAQSGTPLLRRRTRGRRRRSRLSSLFRFCPEPLSSGCFQDACGAWVQREERACPHLGPACELDHEVELARLDHLSLLECALPLMHIVLLIELPPAWHTAMTSAARNTHTRVPRDRGARYAQCLGALLLDQRLALRQARLDLACAADTRSRRGLKTKS